MNYKLVIPVWAIGSFLIVLNTTMFNVSVPSIIHDLNITSEKASWIVSSYSIGFAASSIIFSRLSDFIPIRKLMLYGIITLGISSILGFIVNGFNLLLIARVFQSIGAGSIPGLGMVLSARYVPVKQRGQAISILASASALAFGLGPLFGGSITEFFGWRTLFLVTCMIIPIGSFLYMLLPEESTRRNYFDAFGAIILVLSMVNLLLTFATFHWMFLLISSISILALYFRLCTTQNPFIPPKLFQNTKYFKLITIAFFSFILNMAMLFLMPLILTNWYGKSPLMVGLYIFPGATLSSILVVFIGRLIDKYNNLRFLIIGHFIITLALFIVSVWIGNSPLVVSMAYLLFAPSLSTITASLANEISQILPDNLIGSGLGLSLLMQYTGGSLGVALCGQLLVWINDSGILYTYQQIFHFLLIISIFPIILLANYNKTRN
ncbi:MFS transporter [Sutcliffiella halmapala]